MTLCTLMLAFMGIHQKRDFIKLLARRIEKFLLGNEGFVALYGETELTKDEFYDMFVDAKNNYDRLRKKYNCENAFPHVYDKISKLGRQ